MEEVAAGKERDPDSTAWDRSTMDTYDYNSLGKLRNPVRSLIKGLNINFSSPVLDYHLRTVLKKSPGLIYNIEQKDGTITPIRRHEDTKGKFWEISKESDGRGC